MAYIVTEKCIKCKFTDCVNVCPVECFHEGKNFLVIHPDVCIDCGVCIPECPIDAIISDENIIKNKNLMLKINLIFSKIWPNIIKNKKPLEDSKRWSVVKKKLHLISL